MNKSIVRVHRPALSPEERVRRLEEIKKAAAQLIVATESEKRKEATP